MKIRKHLINQARKKKGYKGKPGSKMNKRFTLEMVRRSIRQERIRRTRNPEWLKKRDAEKAEKAEKAKREEEKKKFKKYKREQRTARKLEVRS